MRIKDVMSKSVVSVSPTTRTAAAREALRSGEIEHLVVVEGKQVVGVVAREDIAQADRAIAGRRDRAHGRHDRPGRDAPACRRDHARPGDRLPSRRRWRPASRRIVTTSDLLTALAKGDTHTTRKRTASSFGSADRGNVPFPSNAARRERLPCSSSWGSARRDRPVIGAAGAGHWRLTRRSDGCHFLSVEKAKRCTRSAAPFRSWIEREDAVNAAWSAPGVTNVVDQIHIHA